MYVIGLFRAGLVCMGSTGLSLWLLGLGLFKRETGKWWRTAVAIRVSPMLGRLGASPLRPNRSWVSRFFCFPRMMTIPHFISMRRQAWAWTNNVELSESHEADSHFWSLLDLTFRPRLVENLYGDVDLSYETYRYDEHSSLDTDEQDFKVGLDGSLVSLVTLECSPTTAMSAFSTAQTLTRSIPAMARGSASTNSSSSALRVRSMPGVLEV